MLISECPGYISPLLKQIVDTRFRVPTASSSEETPEINDGQGVSIGPVLLTKSMQTALNMVGPTLPFIWFLSILPSDFELITNHCRALVGLYRHVDICIYNSILPSPGYICSYNICNHSLFVWPVWCLSFVLKKQSSLLFLFNKFCFHSFSFLNRNIERAICSGCSS